MHSSLGFVALVVPDLRAAEEYYRSLFDMQLIGREAQLEDGLWYTLPFDKDWEDAKSAGIELGMLALRKEQFVLALFSGDAPKGQVFAIGLSLPPTEIAGVRSQLPAGSEVDTDEPQRLEFRDPYQITWQISPGGDFRTAGDFANRWLEL
jgi:catechol 2,3-dioxygenase-like lactoylglutathione lyase family enzyme